MKAGDKIRDFTEIDETMSAHWIIGGKKYVPYTILHVGKEKISALRMASPKLSLSKGDDTYKIFSRRDLKRASQSIGIYEYEAI